MEACTAGFAHAPTRNALNENVLSNFEVKNYVQLFDTIEQNGVALEVTPYFLINVSGEGEGFSMWSPTPCDVLATDWVEVHD